MVAINDSRLCCISPKVFQLLANINTEFPYTTGKLCLYKKDGIELIKETAWRIQSELNVLVDNTIFHSFLINESHFKLVLKKIQFLASMVDDLLGISAYKLWSLLSGYVADLKLVSKLLTAVH